jgi:hypothetical protein
MSGRSRTRTFRSSNSVGSHTVCRSRRSGPRRRRCLHTCHHRTLRRCRSKRRPRILDRPCSLCRSHCHSERHRSWCRRIRRRNTRGRGHKRRSRRPHRQLHPQGYRRLSWSPPSRPRSHPGRHPPRWSSCRRWNPTPIPLARLSTGRSCRSHRSHHRNRCSRLLEQRAPAARGLCTTPPRPPPN